MPLIAPDITQQPLSQTICANSDITFSIAATNATLFQWQVNTGSGFTNISEQAPYSNVNSPNLKLVNVPSAYQNYMYRCITGNSSGTTTSAEAVITIASNWTGGQGNDWSDAANWSCNAVPDINTNVEIFGRISPTVYANSAVRNIAINSGNTLTVSSNQTLTIGGNITGYGDYIATATNALTVFSSEEPQDLRTGTYSKVRIAGGDKQIAGLERTLTILENFDFESGKVLLDFYNVNFAPSASISNYGKAKYFVLDYMWGGALAMHAGSTGQIFPIGTQGSYTPITITHNGNLLPFRALILDGAYTHFNGGDAQEDTISSGVVNKTWFFYPGDDNSAQYGQTSLTVQWNESDEKPMFNRNRCALATIVGNSIYSHWQFNELKAASGANPYSLTRNNVKYGRFAVTSTDALPVRLVSFEADRQDKAVSLHWRTADAINLSHFEVERSLDGKTFVKQWIEPYQEGKHDYQVLDSDFNQIVSATGMIYYRLKMVDNDATFAYSQIKKIVSDQTSQVLFASPNPFHNKFKVRVPGNISVNPDMTLTNMSGQMILFKKVNYSNREFIIEVDQRLPAGSYILTIQDRNAMNHVKLVKQ